MNGDCRKDRELDFIISVQKEMSKDIKQLLKDVAEVKVKTTVWGGISGALSGLMVAISAIIVTLYSQKP